VIGRILRTGGRVNPQISLVRKTHRQVLQSNVLHMFRD
jgi:hypothetical protein